MWICPHHRAVFVHIPRTGGTSVQHALAHSCRHGLVDLVAFKHATAADIIRLIDVEMEDDPGRYTYWSVARSPWEIVESSWRWRRDRAETIPITTEMRLDSGWRVPDELRRAAAYPDFAAYVQAEWGREAKSPWFHHCVTLYHVRPILFPALRYGWRAIPCVSAAVELPHLSRADREPGRWTPELIDLVGRACEWDIAQFHWRPPQSD